MEKIASAKKLEAEGRAAEAAALYEQAFGETDEDWMAVKAGELYRAAGNAKKGRQVIDRVIGCGNPIIYDRLLRFYFDTGDYKGASDLFSELFLRGYVCPLSVPGLLPRYSLHQWFLSG